MGSNGSTNGTHTGKVLIQVSSRLRARCTSEENELRSWTILLFLRALLYNSFENRRIGHVVINVRMPWVYSAINKRWHQNVVRTSVTNSTAPCCYPFLFLQTFWRHLRVLTEQTRGNIYLSSKRQAIYSLLSKFSLWRLREEGRGMDTRKKAFIQFPTSPPTFLVSFLRPYIGRVYCTKIYPIALMYLSPLSGEWAAAFPHVVELSGYPPVPNPILESHEPKSL